MRYVKTFLLIIAITVLFSCSSFAASSCDINVAGLTRTNIFGVIDFFRDPGVRLSKAQLKIGKKYYKAKLKFEKTSDPYYQYCSYNFYFPTQKKGKKATIIVTDTKGKKYTKKVTLKKTGKIYSFSTSDLLESDSYIDIKASDLRKGDTINIKIGTDIYSSKVTKDYYTKKKKVRIPVYNLKPGYQYKVYIADKYNYVRASYTDYIIYG